MTPDKAIKSGNEYRKPYYRRSKAFDPACAKNICPHCLENALHSTRKRKDSAINKEKTYD